MSVGATYDPTQPAPFDPNALTPEDQQRIAAQMAQPAPPVIPSPSPGAPPPAPPETGIAGINPTAVSQSIAAVGQPPMTVTASPPPAPSSAPSASPAASSATPAAAETPKQTDELKAAQSEAEKSRIANDKAQVDFQKAQEPFVHERENLANQQVANQQEAIRQQQEIQKRYQAAEDAANQQIQASQDAIKKFKFRDYFSDGEGGTNWVRKIGAALAAAAGAYGAGLTHGPNYALQILNKDMDDAHAHQVDELGKMKDEEVMQRTGLNDIRAARQKALADLTVNDAARDRLIGAQLEQVSARQKTAEFAPGLAKFAAQLKQDADEKDALAKKQLVELNLKLQDEGRKKELDTATINEKNAQAGLANAKAGHLKGGGGGGGGGVTGDAVSKLKDAIQNGKDGRPLTAGEIQDIANGLHIPAFAKAGHPSVEAITKSVAFVQGQGAKEDKQSNADIDKRAAEVKKEVFGPKGPGTQYERLNGMTSVVKNALQTGDKTAATAVLEEAGGMLSGGKSTKNTVALLEELRSTRDELAAKWGHLTGNPGASAAFTARLNGLLNRVKEEKRQEIDQIRQRAVDTELGEHGLAKAGKAKERALGHLSMFNGITNENGTPRYGGGSAGPQAAQVTPEARAAAQTWLNAHPSDPRAAAVRAKAGL